MSRFLGIRILADELTFYGTEDNDFHFLQGPERIAHGYGGNDFLYANNEDSFLYGGEGNDILISGPGADYLHGGSEPVVPDSLQNGPFIGDMAHYEGSEAGVYVNLGSGKGYWGDAEGDVLVDIESLGGSNYNDILVGDNAANALWGLEGADNLLGLGGDDVLVGGANGFGNAADFLSGGSGDDLFVFYAGHHGNSGSDSSAATGIDFIADFGHGDDQIAFVAKDDLDGPVTWSADATNFSVAGHEIWYEHTTDATHGDVTMVHAQFQIEGGGYQYFDVMLDEHLVLVQNDFMF